MDIGWVSTLLLVATGVPVGLASLYLLALAAAALLYRPRHLPDASDLRLAVLVPAHDEEVLLPRCLASLASQSYPADRVRIAVIVDNCSDATAEVARRSGAEVMIRTEPGLPGKGRALRWAIDRLLAAAQPPDAIAVVDADSVADPGLLAGLAAALAAGAEAAQGDYEVLDEGDPSSGLRQASFLLFHRARFSGRAVLGLACSLVGNGMAFRRELLERIPWSAYTGAEDLEYSTDLRLSGVRPQFVSSARIAAPASGVGRAAAVQRMRWEGGRFHVMATRLPRLLGAAVRRRDPRLLEAAVDLATPPLGLLVALSALGSAAAIAAVVPGAVRLWGGAPWWAASVLLALYVVVGLRAARAPASAYRALLLAPRFLAGKVATYLAMTRGLRADRWERTQRPGEAIASGRHPVASGSRLNVCGVPVDAVDECAAVDRMIAAIGGGRLLQVGTVNLQFLVSARRHRSVRNALSATGLNVADGTPLLWLARLLGRPLPARVAGADLVPALMRRAAESDVRVFLLGGTGGVAARAAEMLRRAHPGLRVTGTHEPPRTALAEMADEEILATIRNAGADILLVGLGHPKQELWIARNRDRLPVSVAIGVGGTFDLIAGRLRRAPSWARRSGLEWFFRLVQEPRRLGLRYAACGAWLVGVLLPLAAWQRLQGIPAIVSAEGAEPPPLAAEPGS